MLKRVFLALIIALPISLQAQHTEIGLLAGISNYQGDLAPSNLKTSLGQTHAAFGIFGRYNFGDFVAARLGFNYATISGDDAKYDRKRNLSFRSSLLEFSLTGEFNILGYQPYALQRVFSPYVFAGVAMTHFNPRTKYDGEWVELQPLGTEGQGIQGYPSKYNLLAFSIPVGIGVKYALNDRWNIGLEVGMRKTFTDYLDDVSTNYVEEDVLLAGNGELAATLANRTGGEVAPGSVRGNPDNDDWYVITGITVSYNFLDNGLVGSRSRSRRKSGCNTNF